MSWEACYRMGMVPWVRTGVNPAADVWFPPGSPDSLKGKRILIPGCGTSPEPIAFARRGARVTAIDIAPSAIDKQRRLAEIAGVSGLELMATDMLSWRPEIVFDLIYEQTALCALPPADRAAYEAMAFDVLAPGGHLHALFMQTRGTGGPPYHCDLVEMRLLFRKGRWQWSKSKPIESPHPTGVLELGYVLRRV